MDNNLKTIKKGDVIDTNSIICDAKFKRKGNIEEYKMTRDKKFKSVLSFDLNKCCYCSKVFLNSTFLIKHLLRRHSDNLRKTRNVTECDSNSMLSYEDLIQYSLFQNVLGTMKFFNHIILSKSENILENVPVQEEINDLKTKFSKMKENLLYLEKAFDRFNSEQSDNILDETKINKLRERLFEFQFSTHQNSESNLNFMGFISDLQTEIERLKFFIKANSEKIDTLLQSVSSEAKEEVELNKRLENDITMFSSNMENEIYKKSLKEATHISKKPYIVPQIAHKKKRHKCKSLHIGKQSFIRESNNLNSVQIPLEEKLKTLHISGDIERLRTLDYDLKMRCVHAEKEALSKKYNSFLSIRNNLDSYSDELVLSKLNDKKSKKKLRFFLPKHNLTNYENDLAAGNYNLNVCSSVCFATKKKEIPNSSASLKLFNFQNNCKLSDISYNSAEELSPVCIFESKGDCEKVNKESVVDN